MAEGFKVVDDLLALQPADLIVATGEWLRGKHFGAETEVIEVTDEELKKVSFLQHPQQVLAVFRQATSGDYSINTSELSLALDGVQDPGNLGTILRTLAWFGGFRCLLSPGSVDPYNPKVVRSSMGAIFHAPLELDVDLPSLSTRFERIACLDMQGEPLQSASFKDFDCYLFGNEARGVPHEQLSALKAHAFTIPGCGAIESLNLATTVNLCVYELNR